MSPYAIAKVAVKKKQLTEDRKNQMLKAGGSIKQGTLLIPRKFAGKLGVNNKCLYPPLILEVWIQNGSR